MAKPVPRSPIKRMPPTVVRFYEQTVRPLYGFRSGAWPGRRVGPYSPGPRNG